MRASTMLFPLLFLFCCYTTATFISPSTTLPNGAVNLFYPCPAAETSSCPYRCYQAPANLTENPVSLLPNCYNSVEAAELIANDEHICVRCLKPLAKEQSVSADSTATCEPLAPYFNTTTPKSATPARVGFLGHTLRNCTFSCAEAQVPFSICSATNASGKYEVCEKSLPQCSTPRIVFDPLKLPEGFSLSNGTCDEGFGAPALVACRFRCTDAGNPYPYCSLVDRGSTDTYSTCVSCA